MSTRNIPVSELDISVRCYNFLAVAKIHTLGELVDISLEELNKVKNFGSRSLLEINNVLTKYGYPIKGDDNSRFLQTIVSINQKDSTVLNRPESEAERILLSIYKSDNHPYSIAERVEKYLKKRKLIKK